MDHAGVSQDELARQLNLSKEVFEAIEKGTYDPPLSVAHKLADALGIPLAKLYTDTPNGVPIAA